MNLFRKNISERAQKKDFGHSFFYMEILDRLFYIIAVIPIIIFIFWPIVALFLRSISPDGEFTLELYNSLFKENFTVIKDSIWVCLLSTTLSVIIGTVIAVYITYASKWVKRMLMLLLMLTMISPPFLSSLSYILLFGKRGIITADLLHLNFNPYGWHGIVIMQTFSEISLAALILTGGLSSIPSSVIEAAKDLGSKSGEILYRVILPMLKSSLTAVFFLIFVKNIADFGTPISGDRVAICKGILTREQRLLQHHAQGVIPVSLDKETVQPAYKILNF